MMSSPYRVALFALALAASGCAAQLPGGSAAQCDDPARPAGYTFVGVDARAYPRYERDIYGTPLAPECTSEALAASDSPYRSRGECRHRSVTQGTEKGYLYGVCTPGDSLLYVLSRVPERLDRQTPEGFEPVVLGRTYARLDGLRPLPTRDTTVYRGPSEIQRVTMQLVNDPDDVPAELNLRYRPLASDALFGRYIRTGLRVGAASSDATR